MAGTLNLETIQELRSLDPEGGLLREVVDMFRVKAPAQLARIREAQARGDEKAVSFEAHSLRSSTGTLGAMPLFELCRRIEKLEGGIAALGALVTEADAELARVIAALEVEAGRALRERD